MLTMMNKKL